MAFPTYVAAGLLQESTATLTVSDNITPTNGDYQLLVIETANEAATLTTANGFTAFPGDIGQGAGIYGTGAAAGLTSTRLTLFERIYSGQADPVTNDPGNHIIANIFTFRKSSGSWSSLADVRSSVEGTGWKATIQSTEVTAASMDGITTDTADQLIVGITCAAKPDIAGGTTEMGAVTNSNLASITERFDDAAASGNGGWIGLWTGQEATSGQAIGASTWTKTATSVMAHIVIGIRDAAPAGGVTHSRSASFDATAAIAVSAHRILDRSVAIGASADVATQADQDHVKSVAFGAAAAIATARQLEANRQVLIGSTALIAAAKQVDHIKSVAIGATADFSVAATQVLRVFERAVALAATADISVANVDQDHVRSLAFQVAVDLSVSDFMQVFERAVAIGAAVGVDVVAVVEGPAEPPPFVFEDEEWRFKGMLRAHRRAVGWSGTGASAPTHPVPGRAQRLAKWNDEGSAHE